MVRFLSPIAVIAILGPALLRAEPCHEQLHAPSPASLMGTHLHKEGEGMVSVRYMFLDTFKNGAPSGHESGGHSHAKHGGHDHDNPTAGQLTHDHDMSMEMIMAEAMYGVTDDVTLMLSLPFNLMEMDHDDPEGAFTTRADGVGDLSVVGLMSVYRGEGESSHLQFGASFPTGDVTDRDEYHGSLARHPYHMRLGSGTVDLLPGITYLGEQGGWGWGAQGLATVRLGSADGGYTLGDKYRVNSWASYLVGPSAAITARVSGEVMNDVEGTDRNSPVTSPLYNPNEQGGAILDAGFGVSARIYGAITGIEILFPLAQSWDDGQPDLSWGLAASLSVVF